MVELEAAIMPSLISCKPNEQKSTNDIFLQRRTGAINLIVPKTSKASMHLIMLITYLIILQISLLCIQAQAYESPSCFCHGKLYRFCPEECRRRPSLLSSVDDLLEDNLVDKHPDHLYDTDIDRIKTPIAVKQFSASPVDAQGVFKQDDGEIVVHRKVYVTGKPVRHPIIHPIKITVPVTYKDQGVVLDAPEPVFKLKTYTEYETKPETFQVPVETTIIKPKNIKKNQLIFS